jgi:hypothetical protein
MTHAINEDGTMEKLDKSSMYWFDEEQVFDCEDRLELNEVDIQDHDEWVEKNM